MSSTPVGQSDFASHDESAAPLRASTEALPEASSNAAIDTVLKSIIADVLGLAREDADALTADSGLFGHLPELDSMAVAGLLTEIEDQLDIVIEDDEVDGEMLETYGALHAFVEGKTAEG